MKMKAGDKVMVISGKDRGKSGKAVQVFHHENKASVEGVNLMMKHLKKRSQGQSGQKVQFPGLIDISKLMVICPKCSKPVRLGKKRGEDKKLHRFCKKCKEFI